MKWFRLAVAPCLALISCSLSQAQEPPRVLVMDSGVQTGTIGQWERGLPALKLKALLNEI